MSCKNIGFKYFIQDPAQLDCQILLSHIIT